MALSGLFGLFICRVREKNSQTYLHFRCHMSECQSHISRDHASPYSIWWSVKKNQKAPDVDKQMQ